MSTVEGLVISRFGAEADIETAEGIVRCHLRRKFQDLVCGDRVLVDMQHQGPVVVERMPRATVLLRSIRYQGLKPVAANLDQVVVILTHETSLLVVDKYLVAIALARLRPVLFINKCDIAPADALQPLRDIYTQLQMDLLEGSAATGEGLEALREHFPGRTSVLVGQSGVGKSTIINRLVPDAEASTAVVSATSGLGTHTTTVSRLYHLPSGGSLIDSPGIREFTVGHVEPRDLPNGFPEIAAASAHCRFRDCSHTREPGCAVRLAADNGQIHTSRYNHYLRMLQEATASDT